MPSQEIQQKAIACVREYRTESEKLSQPQRDRYLRIYRAYKTFKEDNNANDLDRSMRTNFKVNKAHEIVEKVVVRLIGKDPRWIVVPRNVAAFASEGEEVYTDFETENGMQRDFSKQMKDRSQEWCQAVQDYLTYIFDEYNLRERYKILAKSLAVYGKTFAKPVWKYEVARVEKIREEESVVVDEETGEEIETITEKKKEVEEKVIGQYPTIDPISWTDIFYDPRYVFLDDRPAMVEFVEGVRFADLLRQKKEYMNLDQIEDIITLASDENLTLEDYKRRVRYITGITDLDPMALKKNALSVTKYYGLFSPTDEAKDEKMWEIWTVADMVVIKMQEITRQPIDECKCFDDPETAYATGFVEPIVSLQEELNWKKNSASEYINQMLTRRFIWSPMSGINPKDVMNPIIPTVKSGQEALANFPELKLSEIHPSYFQEQNDFERQIQAMSFTVDTSNPRNENALTNTATGARIKFFESNSVLDEVRKVFERFMERTAYSLLMMTFENQDTNIVFKKTGTEDYWNVNKEFLRDAVQRYSIKIEANSSSFDDIESRREDSISFFNTLMLAKQAGVPINFTDAIKDVITTYEKKDPDKYVSGMSPLQALQQTQGSPIGQPTSPINESAALTDEVAKGNITSMV